MEVTLNNDGRVVLTGEASSEKSIIDTLQSLKTNAFLQDTLLDSFGRQGDSSKVGTLWSVFRSPPAFVGILKMNPTNNVQ